ncbi:MAG TPA: hypothetical protein ENK06_00715, partial [Gammaproteobacteria bacterium]|nr:hypothetical protein [Gammaproteobacteria bacterium]
ARHVNESLSSTSSSNSLRELFGMNPPDLSVMAKARRNGPQYIYALLSSYYERSEGHYDNQVFPGIKMPDVFAYSLAIDTLEKEKIQNRIKDVSAFLLWASDPKAEERRAMGKYVLGYLIILSLMFYVLMKRVWKRLD